MVTVKVTVRGDGDCKGDGEGDGDCNGDGER